MLYLLFFPQLPNNIPPNPPQIKFTNAVITKRANGVSELVFTLRRQSFDYITELCEHNAQSFAKTVFLAEGMYFSPVQKAALDSKTGEYTITCRDLFNTIIYGELCKDTSYTFENASITSVLTKLINIPPFTLTYIPLDYSAVTGDYYMENRQKAIQDIRRRYGDFDIVVNGLNIEVHIDYKRPGNRPLIKGLDCSVIDFLENYDDVITHIRYQYADDIEEYGKQYAPVYTETSPFAALMPFTRDVYVELPDRSPAAYKYMVTDLLNADKLPRLYYKLRLTFPAHGEFDIFDSVTMQYAPLNLDLSHKVISVTRRLGKTNSKDILEIGEKRRGLVDYLANLPKNDGSGGGKGGDTYIHNDNYIGPNLLSPEVQTAYYVAGNAAESYLFRNTQAIPAKEVINIATSGEIPEYFYASGTFAVRDEITAQNIDTVIENATLIDNTGIPLDIIVGFDSGNLTYSLSRFGTLLCGVTVPLGVGLAGAGYVLCGSGSFNITAEPQLKTVFIGNDPNANQNFDTQDLFLGKLTVLNPNIPNNQTMIHGTFVIAAENGAYAKQIRGTGPFDMSPAELFYALGVTSVTKGYNLVGYEN